MLLTMKQLIERSGKSRFTVYHTLKDAGIEISDFYDDSVLRYFRKEIPEGLLSVKQMAGMSGLSVDAVRNRLFRAHIKIAFNNGNERFYDASALEALTRKRKTLTDEERKERKKESNKKYKDSHCGLYREASRKYYKAHREEIKARDVRRRRSAKFEKFKGGYFFVSVADFFGRYVVKAVCLSYPDARMISEELNVLGIRAHFKSHIKA